MKIFRNAFLAVGLIFTLASGAVLAGENNTKRAKRSEPRLDIKITPWGPSQETTDAAKARVERSTEVQTLLKGAKYRLLEFNYIESESKSTVSVPPTRFQAVFYDYTNDRAIFAESDFAGQEAIKVREEFYQPIPNDEEFDEAVSILQQDKRFGSLLKDGLLKPFRPMPPTTVFDGTIERLVNVGLAGTDRNEIVSVGIKRGEVIRYESGAPPSAQAAPEACGIPQSGQGTTSAGTAGQYQMTVTQGQTTLWEMLIIRPSASSGATSKRSGIEVRDVKYKGKSVLSRGHVPILNVQYTGGQCGPYRDWQYQEDMFQVPTTGTTYPNGVNGGIALVPDGQIATTALESGNDTGTFKGVAVYKQDVGFGMETVLITELQAGWYRYIMEWRFAPDGTIRPRFGFGATDNSCVCFVHNHHAYWRLDFDVVQPNNKVFQVERGRKFLKPLATEMFTARNFQSKRSLLIQNSNGDEAYQVSPNLSDGTADVFGVHDMWVLRFQGASKTAPTQLEDGITCVTCSTAYIQIDPFVNNESIVDQDVVVWYGAHFIHNDQGNRQLSSDRTGMVISGEHVVGPDLRPIRW